MVYAREWQVPMKEERLKEGRGVSSLPGRLCASLRKRAVAVLRSEREEEAADDADDGDDEEGGGGSDSEAAVAEDSSTVLEEGGCGWHREQTTL